MEHPRTNKLLEFRRYITVEEQYLARSITAKVSGHSYHSLSNLHFILRSSHSDTLIKRDIGNSGACSGTGLLVALVGAKTARALFRTLTIRTKTLTIFANASIVLASTPQTLLTNPSLEGIRTLFEALLDSLFAPSVGVFLCVQTANTGTNTAVANLTSLEARAIQLEAPRTNAVTGYFAWRELVEGISQSSGVESSRVTGQDAPDGFGSCTFRPTLGNGILAANTAASAWVATTTSFEAVAVQRDTFRLWTATA